MSQEEAVNEINENEQSENVEKKRMIQPRKKRKNCLN